jgi:hypothetical protein
VEEKGGGTLLAGDATQLTDILKVGLDHLLQSEERYAGIE